VEAPVDNSSLRQQRNDAGSRKNCLLASELFLNKLDVEEMHFGGLIERDFPCGALRHFRGKKRAATPKQKERELMDPFFDGV